MSFEPPKTIWEKIHTYLLLPIFVVLLIGFFYTFSQDMESYTRPLALTALVIGLLMRFLRVKINRNK